MLNGPLGTGSDLLQTRSDQAWTEVAWEVAEAVQQELEVPSSRTGSSTSEIGSGLAGRFISKYFILGGCYCKWYLISFFNLAFVYH